MLELSEFIVKTDEGFKKEVEEGDYNGLVDCMLHLIAVRDRQPTTDEMFEPLKETIELLKTYNQEMPEEVLCFILKNTYCDFESCVHVVQITAYISMLTASYKIE